MMFGLGRVSDNSARWNIAAASIRRNCGSAKSFSMRVPSQAFHIIFLFHPVAGFRIIKTMGSGACASADAASKVGRIGNFPQGLQSPKANAG